MAYPEMTEDDIAKVRKDYEDFWKELVEVDGEIDLDRVKAELSDFHIVLDHVPKVYSHITGGNLSKANYFAEDVIAHTEEHYQQERRNQIEDEFEMGVVRIDTFDEEFADDLEEFIETTDMFQSGDCRLIVETLFEYLRENSLMGDPK